MTLLFSPTGRRYSATPPFPLRFLRICRADTILGIPFSASNGHGCLIVPNRRLQTDDLLLAQVIATKLGTWADDEQKYREANVAAARHERLALARTLHATVLQTLAAASMQLSLIRPIIAAAHPEVVPRIDRLMEAFSNDSVVIQGVVQQLRSESAEHGGCDFALR